MKKLLCLLFTIVFVSVLFIGCDKPNISPKSSPKQASSKTASASREASGFWSDSSQSPAASAESAAKTPAQAGWYLTDTQYLKPDCDLEVNGGPVRSTLAGTPEPLLDYYKSSGETGSIILSHYRTDKGGTVLASTKWAVHWSEPPSSLTGGQIVSIDVEHTVIETVVWGPPAVVASVDVPDLLMSGVTTAVNKFHQPNGSEGTYKDTREEVYNTKATMTTEYPIGKGKAGDRMAIYIKFGEGYGMRYTYTWS